MKFRIWKAVFVLITLLAFVAACGGSPVEEAASVAAPPTATATPPPPTATPLPPTATPTPQPTATAESVAADEAAEAAEFTAVIGLDSFSAYRIDFETAFDGSLRDQPTQGAIAGLFEMTRDPQAQHWQVSMEGDAFQQLAMLRNLNLYKVGGVVYIKNPGDDSWIGVPENLVNQMLPVEMYTPEDSIELPASAMLQPEPETINDIPVRRYTFGKEDLSGDNSGLESASGVVWVAVDGNYVVRYEAELSGQFDNLSAGGVELIDQGTITMMYEVSNINNDMEILPPEGASGFNLGQLFSR